jgi:fibronectin type III domain protein
MKVFLILSGACVIALAICFNWQLGAQANPSLAALAPGDPEPPRVYLNTAYVAPTVRTITVNAGGSLQSALNQAQPGDLILLQAGATFTGNFVLPNKTGTGWVTVRASTPDANLPQGTRVTPASASLMPKIISPNSEPALQTVDGAHNYRFVGIEFGVAAGMDIYNIISFGGDQTSLAQTPRDLIIDRCYIHGNAGRNARRGVMINSASTAIIDSYISDIHEVGADAQAVCGWNAPGPFKIVNNYLEASGENIMFGGAPPSIPNVIPSDIEFRLNNVSKPLSWKADDPSFAGIRWSVKNLFELKNAQRVLVDQNVFEYNWLESQTGFAILFTPRAEDGLAPQATVADVTFTNNVLRHSGSGFNIAGADCGTCQPSQRILIKNNLIFDIDGDRWGRADGRALQFLGGVNVTVDHNTFIQTGPIIMADVLTSPGFVFRNNIAPHMEYGVIGSGIGVGISALNYYFPGYIFQKNVIAGVPAGVVYPTDNFLPTSLNLVGFVNMAAGDYRLGPTSPYRNAGTDGKDIGCQLVLSTTPPPTPTPTPTPRPAPTPAPTPTPTPAPAPTPRPTPTPAPTPTPTPAPAPTPRPTPTPAPTPTPTPAPAPTMAISNVRARQVTSSNAVIKWTTSAPSNSQVEYGRTIAYGGLTPLNAALVATHQVTLADLVPETRYHYRAKSRDAAGNLVVSRDFTFITAAAPQGGGIAQPVIWTEIVKATLTGTTLLKTAGCDGCESTAVSKQMIASGNGYLEIVDRNTNKDARIGLMRSGKSVYAVNIDYAIDPCVNGTVSVRELGRYRTETTCRAGDDFRVAVENGAVNYYKNGAVIYRSRVAPVYPLVVAVSLISLDASVSDAVIVTVPTATVAATALQSAPIRR